MADTPSRQLFHPAERTDERVLRGLLDEFGAVGMTVHMRRQPGSTWALCRGIRGALVTDAWPSVTCGHCLKAINQQFQGDYSQRHRAYSKAISQLRDLYREEFEDLYRSALEKERWKAGETR